MSFISDYTSRFVLQQFIIITVTNVKHRLATLLIHNRFYIKKKRNFFLFLKIFLELSITSGK